MSLAAARWRPWVVVVGGFLGAGKTSLILTASSLLKKRGYRCAVVLNDQGNNLVDTRLVEQHGIPAGEVTDGCFCCRLTDMLSTFERLHSYAPDVIFAEPVGSCTDIVATVLRPLLEDFEHYRVAPFTVVLDPARLSNLLRGEADPNINFLMRKQVEEADLICLTKADRYPDSIDIPGVQFLRISAKSGAGVEEWLDQVLAGCRETDSSTLELDYDRYARAEAALAWLNLSLRLEQTISVSPASLAGPLFEGLDEKLSAAGISILHLKLMDRCPNGWLKAAISGNGEFLRSRAILTPRRRVNTNLF
jgi:CobW/HypB/UreG, nucleotide-binding domain